MSARSGVESGRSAIPSSGRGDRLGGLVRDRSSGRARGARSGASGARSGGRLGGQDVPLAAQALRESPGVPRRSPACRRTARVFASTRPTTRSRARRQSSNATYPPIESRRRPRARCPRSSIAPSARSAAAPIVITSPAAGRRPNPGWSGRHDRELRRQRRRLRLPHPRVERPRVEQEQAVGHVGPAPGPVGPGWRAARWDVALERSRRPLWASDVGVVAASKPRPRAQDPAALACASRTSRPATLRRPAASGAASPAPPARRARSPLATCGSCESKQVRTNACSSPRSRTIAATSIAGPSPAVARGLGDVVARRRARPRARRDPLSRPASAVVRSRERLEPVGGAGSPTVPRTESSWPPYSRDGVAERLAALLLAAPRHAAGGTRRRARPLAPRTPRRRRRSRTPTLRPSAASSPARRRAWARARPLRAPPLCSCP